METLGKILKENVYKVCNIKSYKTQFPTFTFTPFEKFCSSDDFRIGWLLFETYNSSVNSCSGVQTGEAKNHLLRVANFWSIVFTTFIVGLNKLIFELFIVFLKFLISK